MPRPIEVSAGDRYGRLVILREEDRVRTRSGSTQRRMLCRCDCGSERIIRLNELRFGRSRSCGCLANEETAERNRRNATHGKTNSPEFVTWKSMRQRCNDESHRAYASYGGRGIKVCERWQESFEAFLEDMGERPSLNHSLDRYPDNDGDYEPENCRWATREQQGRNKSNNVILSFRGEEMCLTAWAERVGVTAACLSERLKRGWTVESALTIPAGGKHE